MRSESREIGLERNSPIPASRQSARSSPAVTATIGIRPTESGSARARRVAAGPSITGIAIQLRDPPRLAETADGYVLQPRIIYLYGYAVRRPLEAPADDPVVRLAGFALEDMGTAGVGRPAEFGQDSRGRFPPVYQPAVREKRTHEAGTRFASTLFDVQVRQLIVPLFVGALRRIGSEWRIAPAPQASQDRRD